MVSNWKQLPHFSLVLTNLRIYACLSQAAQPSIHFKGKSVVLHLLEGHDKRHTNEGCKAPSKHLAGIEPTTLRVFLSRHVLYRCATTAGFFNKALDEKLTFFVVFVVALVLDVTTGVTVVVFFGRRVVLLRTLRRTVRNILLGSFRTGSLLDRREVGQTCRVARRV